MADDFHDDIIEELIDRLGNGEGLATICRDPRMPARSTVQRWMRADDELAARIMDARELGFHDRAERAVQEVRDAADPIKARVVFDAERWYLGKLSQAFADKPLIGVALNVDAGDAIAAVADVLEGAAAAISGRRVGSYIVDENGSARPVNAPGGGLAQLDAPGGKGLRQDPNGS